MCKNFTLEIHERQQLFELLPLRLAAEVRVPRSKS